MLADSDAALIIGDPALRIDPETTPFQTLIWARNGWSGRAADGFCGVGGTAEVVTPEVAAAFQESCEWGRAALEGIVTRAAAERGFPPELVRGI